MPTTDRGKAQRAVVEKVLALEREKAFADTAVVGGLEGFIARHVPEASHLVSGYAGRDPESRAQAVTAGGSASDSGVRSPAAPRPGPP